MTVKILRTNKSQYKNISIKKRTKLFNINDEVIVICGDYKNKICKIKGIKNNKFILDIEKEFKSEKQKQNILKKNKIEQVNILVDFSNVMHYDPKAQKRTKVSFINKIESKNNINQDESNQDESNNHDQNTHDQNSKQHTNKDKIKNRYILYKKSQFLKQREFIKKIKTKEKEEKIQDKKQDEINQSSNNLSQNQQKNDKSIDHTNKSDPIQSKSSKKDDQNNK